MNRLKSIYIFLLLITLNALPTCALADDSTSSSCVDEVDYAVSASWEDCADEEYADFCEYDEVEVCIITECKDGYELDEDTNECVETESTSTANQAVEQNKAEKKVKESEKEMDDLKKKAADAKSKEQSLANRTTAAAAMGATGIGLMQVASSMSEQKSDAQAETDMAAYLATMYCSYADGKNVKGGEKNVEIPGGNELTALYSQYVKLATDLKVRKQALGMTPGIESQEIIDIASSGLYDDVAIGKTDGAYTSLARALSDESSADATEWNEQKSETAQKLKTGAITAGVGAVVGIAGNVLSNTVGNKSDDTKVKKAFEKIANAFDSAQKIIDKRTVKCTSFQRNDVKKTNATSPDCECSDSNKTFHPEWMCIADINNATNADTITIVNEPDEGEVLVASIKFPSDKTFAAGKHALTNEAKSAIDTIKKAIKNNATLFKNNGYTILITGHSDRIQPDGKDNHVLTYQRADEIKTELIKNNTVLNSKTIAIQGLGSSECPENNAHDDADCRYTEIELYVSPQAVSGLNIDTSAVTNALGGAVNGVARK